MLSFWLQRHFFFSSQPGGPSCRMHRILAQGQRGWNHWRSHPAHLCAQRVLVMLGAAEWAFEFENWSKNQAGNMACTQTAMHVTYVQSISRLLASRASLIICLPLALVYSTGLGSVVFRLIFNSGQCLWFQQVGSNWLCKENVPNVF